jgi:competence protein ComEC
LCPAALPLAPQSATQTQQDPKAQTVYITRTGKKYHREACRYLTASEIPISLKGAKAKGYTACKVCRPPE